MDKQDNYGWKMLHSLVKEICLEKGINCRSLSYDWILELEKDGQVRHILANEFDLNKQAASHIVKDKYATYEVLRNNDISTIEYKLIFNPNVKGSSVTNDGIWSSIIDYFYNHGETIVVKANSGSQGKSVFLCRTLKEVEIAIYKLFDTNSTVSICPYYDILHEYRVFYLDGECYLTFGKEKPCVIGDGMHTVKELISINLSLPNNGIVSDNLNSLNLDYIPQNNERFFLSWKFNIDGGATTFFDIDEDLKNNINSLAVRAAKAIGIDFAAIDVIQTVDNELYIIEINSTVCMGKEEFSPTRGNAKRIYGKAIDKMFN